MGREMTVDKLPNIDLSSLHNIMNFVCVYHDNEDTFFMRPEVPRPATSLDWNGELWVRIDPITGEIVGIEIENFESIFLKKYPGIAKVWQQVKPICNRKRSRKAEYTDWDAFVRIIQEFLSRLFQNRPLQPSFNPTES